MITIKNNYALQAMKHAGQLLAELFDALVPQVVAGTTTGALDAWIEAELIRRKLVTQMKGYGTYRHVSCISINQEVVHGVPSFTRVLHEGDLVKIDVCAAYNGYCADMARCFFVGVAPQEAEGLVSVAQQALNKGIQAAQAGNHIGDISAAIQAEVERFGYGVVRDFAGHGIGKKMHEDPEILNYGKPGKGPLIKPGMAFALEPMITQGNYAVRVLSDDWTVVTVDKSLAAHVEDTVVVTENGPLITTRL